MSRYLILAWILIGLTTTFVNAIHILPKDDTSFLLEIFQAQETSYIQTFIVENDQYFPSNYIPTDWGDTPINYRLAMINISTLDDIINIHYIIEADEIISSDGRRFASFI